VKKKNYFLIRVFWYPYHCNILYQTICCNT